MRNFIIVAAVLLLAGCAEFDAYSHAAVQQKKQYNNSQAVLYVTDDCDMALGAFLRMFRFEQQRALLTLCDANQDIIDFMELQERSREAVGDG